MKKYTGDESNKKYDELVEKYGVDKMIFFCMDYAFKDSAETIPADVKEYFDNAEDYYEQLEREHGGKGKLREDAYHNYVDYPDGYTEVNYLGD